MTKNGTWQPGWPSAWLAVRPDWHGDEPAGEDGHCASRWPASVGAEAMACWEHAASGELLSRYPDTERSASRAASSVRLRAPSLARACATWFSTVRGDRCS